MFANVVKMAMFHVGGSQMAVIQLNFALICRSTKKIFPPLSSSVDGSCAVAKSSHFVAKQEYQPKRAVAPAASVFGKEIENHERLARQYRGGQHSVGVCRHIGAS